MKTKKQEELAGSFLKALDGEARLIYQDLIAYLAELGYHPQKDRSSVSFKHSAHNKQIAKMKMEKGAPYFAMRFSACRGYSKRFADIIDAWMVKYPTRTAGCPSGRCSFCAGEPDTHVYTHSAGGERRPHCGAYALEIPNLTADDVVEIKALIVQEHAYLMEHEAEAIL